MVRQLDNAGCYHSLNLMIRLGLVVDCCVILVKILIWIFSEANDGKDMADQFIGTAKG